MKRSLLFAFSLASSSFVFAHDTWITPSAYSATVDQPVMFEITSGMNFPALDTGPKPNRIAKSGFRLGAESGELKEFTAGENALTTTKPFARDGVATLWVQLLPRDIELTDDDVAHYLDEANAPDAVRAAWERQKGKTKWNEEYVKCAKTGVAVGNAAVDNSWAEPVGLLLEIVPVTNPTTLKAGDKATFKLLRQGKPLAKAALALIRGGSEERVFEMTDADGAVDFAVAKAGKHMVATTILTPPQDGESWKSHFSTFTFEAR